MSVRDFKQTLARERTLPTLPSTPIPDSLQVNDGGNSPLTPQFYGDVTHFNFFPDISAHKDEKLENEVIAYNRLFEKLYPVDHLFDLCLTLHEPRHILLHLLDECFIIKSLHELFRFRKSQSNILFNITSRNLPKTFLEYNSMRIFHIIHESIECKRSLGN